jgi:hypothetical protein
MANLLGQNIGTNYKGILNLNTLNGNLSGTLQAVTDGDGNASALQLSTTKALLGTTAGSSPHTINIGETQQLGSALYSGTYVIYSDFMELRGNSGIQIPTNNLLVGTTSASARLQVRGDGTNPIARFENGAGQASVTFNQSSLGANVNFANAFTLIGNTSTTIFQSSMGSTTSNVGTIPIFDFTQGADGSTASTSNYFRITKSIIPAAGSANFRQFIVDYTINASGAQTGNATGIFLNATETALNGMTHNLMDLQTGGVSKFRVDNFGNITSSSNVTISGQFIISSLGRIQGQSSGVLTLTDSAGTSFNRLQFGGTTNAFPAIKRNGAGIDFRLADDSANCEITCGALSTTGISSLFSGQLYVGSNFTTTYRLNVGAFGSPPASAEMAVTSTTRGFLPPRMTTTQKNAISTPATGLVLYDTTLNKLAVYTGSAWETVTSL